MRRPRLLLALLGAGVWLAAVGALLQPRAVEVKVHPRRDPQDAYWRGALQAPGIEDGGFFLQKLINHYRSPPRPFPHRTPPYRVRFEMDLLVRRDGVHGFELDSPWDGALDVAGERVFGSGPLSSGSGRTGREGAIDLRAGIHRAALSVQPSGDTDQPIRLLWREPGGRLRPMEASDVTMAGSAGWYAFSSRVASPLFFLGAVLVSIAIVVWVREATRESKRDVALATIAVTALALLARAANYDSYPRADLDESHNAWAGYNLIQEGRPRSWSWHPVYDNTRVSWFSYDYPIVPHAFDHTPLLPVLAGLEATLLGARDMYDCVLPRIRPLMVGIGSLSVGTLFLVALRLTSFPTAFLAATLMATSPLVVFGSRLVKEDGLVQLFLLFAVYAHLERRRLWTAVSAGLCAMAKVMGIAVGFALSAVALSESPRRPGPPAAILGVSLLFASLYPLYGLALDAETYRSLTRFLASAYPREALADKALILPRMILEPRISAATPLVDGWILLGWLFVLLLRREKAIAVPFAAYLLVLMVTVNSRNLWGFYLAPVLPFLCLAAAMAMTRALSRLDFLSVFLVVGLGVLPQVATLPAAPGFGGFRVLAVLLFLPLFPAIFRIGAGAARGYLLVLLVASVLANLARCLTTL